MRKTLFAVPILGIVALGANGAAAYYFQTNTSSSSHPKIAVASKNTDVLKKIDLSSLSSKPISITLTTNFNRIGLFEKELISQLQTQPGFSSLTLSDVTFKNAEGKQLSASDIFDRKLNFTVYANSSSTKFTGQKGLVANIHFQFDLDGPTYTYRERNNWIHHAGYTTGYTSAAHMLWNFSKSGVNSWAELKSLFDTNTKVTFTSDSYGLESITYIGYHYPVVKQAVPSFLFSMIKDSDGSSSYTNATVSWVNSNFSGITFYHYLYVWHTDHALYYRYQWGATTAYYTNPWFFSFYYNFNPSQIS